MLMRALKGACCGLIGITAAGALMGNVSGVIGLPLAAFVGGGATLGAIQRSNKRDAYQYQSNQCVEVMGRIV